MTISIAFIAYFGVALAHIFGEDVFERTHEDWIIGVILFIFVVVAK